MPFETALISALHSATEENESRCSARGHQGMAVDTSSGDIDAHDSFAASGGIVRGADCIPTV